MAQLGALRAARAGDRQHPADATTVQALSKAALTAQRARDEAFWALSELNRRVSGRARFCFRRDAKRKALFVSYTVERAGAASAPPPTRRRPRAERRGPSSARASPPRVSRHHVEP